MTVNSPEYLKCTDYDIMLWQYTKAASNQLDSLNRGYSIGDEKLTAKELMNKYPDDVLDVKSKGFTSLSLEKKKKELIKALKNDGKPQETDVSIQRAFIVSRVWSYLAMLKKIGKDQEWIKQSVSFGELKRLPLPEQKKYHDALITFYDQCMREIEANKGTGQSESDRVLDSSPTGSGKDCPPQFDDPTKWEKIDG